jgi:homoprotocatechuate degradation regulator HpaR
LLVKIFFFSDEHSPFMSSPRPSLTLTLLQAREAAMAFFRPSLNQHGLTEQQWRIIRILRQQGEMESYQLAQQACILKPSMTGVLARMERDGIVRRWKSEQDQRQVLVCLTEHGHQCFVAMSEGGEQLPAYPGAVRRREAAATAGPARRVEADQALRPGTADADRWLTQVLAMATRTPIPNIDIGQVYDLRYADSEVHYEELGKLADFFGRNMPVHRHDRFFQVHYVKSGSVRVYLDEQLYHQQGPLFFLTPPTIPHAFVTEADADGHVLTVRQQLLWPLLAPGARPGRGAAHRCGVRGLR